MKRKFFIITLILTSLTTTAFADINVRKINNDLKTEKNNTINNGIIENKITTDGAVKFPSNKDITTQSQVILPENIVDNDILINKILKLNAEIKGTALIGETLFVEVKGFNELDQEIILDESKLKYEWLTEDNEILGNQSEFKIDENMEGLEIHCNVSYEED